jgi:hypothetical protein
MSRASESITRVDVRFSNEMYEQIQQIAIKDGARTHHISQKVEVSPTIVKLVQLGLDAFNGKIPDSNDKLSDSDDSLSDFVSDISDRESIVSAIVTEVSDRIMNSIEGKIDDRVRELGVSQGHVLGLIDSELIRHGLVKLERVQTDIESKMASAYPAFDTIPDNEPDNSSNLPDNAIISDKNYILSVKEPDTQNILSDDSSNSESIAEDVQVIPTEAIEQASGEAETLSWGDFHKMLGLPTTGNPSKAKGDIAIATAKEQKRGTWVMNSSTRKFTKLTEDN